MIDYKLFRFASAPRTGSTWFMSAMAEAGLGEGFHAKVHEPHQSSASATLRVSMVRHPCDWLASYWTAIWPGSTSVAVVDEIRLFAPRDFDDFIRHVLKYDPGRVGRVFAAYNADSYLRLEDMPWAALELLDSLSVPPKMADRIRGLGKRNTSKAEDLPRWDPGLRRRVLEAEREMRDAYDY